jgi:hypothetical protein
MMGFTPFNPSCLLLGRKNRCAAVLFPRAIRGAVTQELFVANTSMRLTIAIAAFAAAMCSNSPVSRAAYGEAPWCFVKGGEDAYWDCQYQSFQECLQVRSGTGFCNVNPAGPPATPAQPQNQKRRS